MKVIDLLNKIVNGEELPKEIRYNGDYWYLEQKFSNKLPYYKNGYNDDNFLKNKEEFYFSESLDEEVEIIVEKKIPEKLKIEQDGQTYNNFYIVNQNGTKCYLTKHSKMILETLNNVIDYLKSKGE